MDLGVEGRIALVMGASRGIGLGIARSLAREGATVALASRSLERVGAAASSLPGRTEAFEADSEDLGRLRDLPAEVEARCGGPIEILVTNTGGPPRGDLLEVSQEDWEMAYRTLVLAPRELIAACLPSMRERGWGRIVNVGSSATVEPIPRLGLSNSHRMATVGMFKTLATEVAAEGITVNTVATGRFATERLAEGYGSLAEAERVANDEVPAGRLGTPDEFGDLVAFLCSDRAAYLTGAVIPLDGGLLRSR